MKGEVLFYEKQGSWRAWWFIVMIAGLLLVAVMAIIESVVEKNFDAWFYVFIIWAFLLIVGLVSLFVFKMQTTITSAGISVMSFDGNAYFAWKDVEEAHICKHRNVYFYLRHILLFILMVLLGIASFRILSYISTSTWIQMLIWIPIIWIYDFVRKKIPVIKKEKYDEKHEVAGHFGLLLILKNGKRVLIGTHKVGELEEVLTKIKDKKNGNNQN